MEELKTFEKNCRLCKSFFITSFQSQDICDNCLKRRKIETESFDQDEIKEMPLDRIETHTTAKGLLQASVKLHSDMKEPESIRNLIERQKYAWDKLKEAFPNLIWGTKEENDGD